MDHVELQWEITKASNVAWAYADREEVMQGDRSME
jgi:hypothetical protein